MTIGLAILAAASLALFVATLLKAKRLQALLAGKDAEISTVKQESDRVRQHYEAEAQRIHREAAEGIASAQQVVDQRLADLKGETDRVREHYEQESLRRQREADAALAESRTKLEALRKYEGLRDAESEVQRQLSDALKEAASLRGEAQSLLEQARTGAAEERSQASRKARELRDQADSMLTRATRDAAQIVEQAERKAEEIAGDAYIALRDKETLEKALQSLWNNVEGYGDRYVIPTRSVLDDLAADFGHTEAGESLKAAREHTRRMVEQKVASACNYVEADRRDRANRFVVDAFNGRVDAILSRTKHDNYGTLEQEIRDTFNLVNLNGIAFRDARILPAYLDARLAELKWAVVVQELKRKEREEQRRIKEQMREEEKARREYERAIREAAEEEEADRKALEVARQEAAHATAEEKSKLESQITELSQRLAEAEAKKQRAISMAEQTRKGTVYIVSNIGSFGEGVFKIGLTRRLEPDDRIRELGDASVPFEFDVHAMIPSDDAPALERMLHEEFDDSRINQVNYRKEFFRLPLERLRSFLTAKGIEISFTMLAEAHEYRETQALLKMTPEQREKYHLRRDEGGDGLGD
jgi:hypothetical protein